MRRLGIAGAVAIPSWVASAPGAAASEADGTPPRVVFVCEHGSVKSLIASRWFDRMAGARGLAARSVSRGLSPDVEVSPAIAERLQADGFDVRAFRPQALAPSDLAGASRLVMIGAPPPPWVAGTAVSAERWDGIPPASERYDASRDALRSRIGELLEALERRGSGP